MTDTEVPRDRYQRPLITPLDGGTPTPYTRISTIAGVLDDKTGIEKWNYRNLARGLAHRPDLLALISANTDNDQAVNRVIDDAKAAGGGDAAANMGTAIHLHTETIDQGGTPWGVPDDRVNDLAAYQQAMHGYRVINGEAFVVVDELRVAGTFDKLVHKITWTPSQPPVMSDLKTGKDAERPGKVAIQLACYAHGHYYNPDTGERTPTGADTDTGLLITVRDNTCAIYSVDLTLGWEAAQLAVSVHGWRQSAKPKALITLLDKVTCDIADTRPVYLVGLQFAHTVEGVRDAYREYVADGHSPQEVEAACRERIKQLDAV